MNDLDACSSATTALLARLTVCSAQARRATCDILSQLGVKTSLLALLANVRHPVAARSENILVSSPR
jgi:hypothetical protein